VGPLRFVELAGSGIGGAAARSLFTGGATGLGALEITSSRGQARRGRLIAGHWKPPGWSWGAPEKEDRKESRTPYHGAEL